MVLHPTLCAQETPQGCARSLQCPRFTQQQQQQSTTTTNKQNKQTKNSHTTKTYPLQNITLAALEKVEVREQAVMSGQEPFKTISALKKEICNAQLQLKKKK